MGAPLVATCQEYAPDAVAEGQRWLRNYLEEDVEQLQLLRQHHVHVPNPQTGEREPLTHCRRADNPKKCKSDFPRTTWLIDRAVLMCPGLIRRCGLSLRGRRSKFGALHGPMNHPYLNGTHPAMLAMLRCNSDVQLPYRFPITELTHCSTVCPGSC